MKTITHVGGHRASCKITNKTQTNTNTPTHRTATAMRTIIYYGYLRRWSLNVTLKVSSACHTMAENSSLTLHLLNALMHFPAIKTLSVDRSVLSDGNLTFSGAVIRSAQPLLQENKCY